jgi:hypothetical protein
MIWLLTAPVGKIEEIPEAAPSATVAVDVSDFYLLIIRDPSNKALPLRMQIVNAWKWGQGANLDKLTPAPTL